MPLQACFLNDYQKTHGDIVAITFRPQPPLGYTQAAFGEWLLALIPFRFYIPPPLLGLLFLTFFVVRCSSSKYAPFPLYAFSLDAFVVNHNEVNRIYTNDGTGVFSVHDASGDTGASGGVGLGDLDGDGDLDAFVVNDGSNQIYTNDGAGVFSVSDASGDTKNSRGVSLGDLDGDGDLDAFVVNNSQTNRVYTNDGNGVFSVRDASPNTKMGKNKLCLFLRWKRRFW